MLKMVLFLNKSSTFLQGIKPCEKKIPKLGLRQARAPKTGARQNRGVLKRVLDKNTGKILWGGIIFYVIVFSLICLFKYSQFGYNGLDLAIYNQVFFNSVHGHLFGFTIHPQSYLGDHFELFILALLPFYYLWQSPIALLILQTIALAVCAWPIFLIAKKFLTRGWALLVAGLWLLNPFTQNINLFEFHLLPFALIFLFFALYFYLENKFRPFIVFILLSLLVREDVSLVAAMFGILALAEKRSFKWILWPIVLGAGWFYLAIKIISYFTPAGVYKFQYYYNWLGATPPQMILNFFIKPLNTLRHIFSINNVLFTLLMFLPFGFGNLLKPKYLLLCLPVFLQIILGGSGNSAVVLKLHYTSLFLPGFFMALIFSLRKIQQASSEKDFFKKYKDLILIIIAVGAVYSLFTLGPLPTAVQKIFSQKSNQESLNLKKELLQGIKPTDGVVAGYDFLTFVSGRPKVYGLNYAFIGKKQLSKLDYNLPASANAILADTEDFLTYGIQLPNDRTLQSDYKNGDDNIRKLIAENRLRTEELIDSLVYFRKNENIGMEMYRWLGPQEKYPQQKPITLNNGLEFLGWEKSGFLSKNRNYKLLPVSLYFKTNKKLDEDFQLTLILKNKNGEVLHQKMYALAYGLYPATEWQPGQAIKINYNFLIPQNIANQEYQPFIELGSIKGFLTLDGWGSAIIEKTEENKLSPQIPLF